MVPGPIDTHHAGEGSGVGEHGELGIERHRIHAERRYRSLLGARTFPATPS